MRTCMIMETMRPDSVQLVYQRFHAKGRLLPDGLHYVDSWLAADKSRCFQLMKTDQPELFTQWFKCWQDLVEFELIEIGDPPGMDD